MSEPKFDQQGQRVNTQINIATGLAESGGCPSCKRIDKVIKITTIFSSGVSGTSLSGSSQSLLSERLAPPPEPTLQGKQEWFISIAVAIMLFICGCIGTTGITDTHLGGGMVLLAVIMTVVGIGGGIVISVGANNAKKKRETELAAKIPRWEKAVARWKRLYYCERDDGVFDLDEGILVPTEEIMKYLYR